MNSGLILNYHNDLLNLKPQLKGLVSQALMQNYVPKSSSTKSDMYQVFSLARTNSGLKSFCLEHGRNIVY